MARIAVLTLLLAATLGCESAITGNEGNFRFSYPADDAIFDFNKPIAVGARLDLRVSDGAPVTLVDVATEDPGVLEVVAFEEDTLTVAAVSDGNTRIQVKGEGRDGEVKTDSVDMMARTAERIVLRHRCLPEADTAAYLVGSPIAIGFDLMLANGDPVIGYGYYPVEPTAEGMVQLDPTNTSSTLIRLDTLGTGMVQLRSTIDDTTLTLVLVEEAALDGMDEPQPWLQSEVRAGETVLFTVRPASGGVPVCEARATLEVATSTPAVCAIRVAEDPAGETLDIADRTWFEIEGLSAGTCSYTLYFPASGLSMDFTQPIVP